MAIGQDLLNVPFGEMVSKLGMAIAESQTKLDRNSIELVSLAAGTDVELPPINPDGRPVRVPVLALGFTPTFYQFAETTIEVKIAITMARSNEFGVRAEARVGWGPFSASVNASYSSKYDYKAEGSSLLRTRLVPVPPPGVLQRYMEALIDQRIQEAPADLQPDLPSGESSANQSPEHVD